MSSEPGEPTKREAEVLHAVVKLGSQHAAAESLFISTETVKTHLDNLREKSGKNTLAQLVEWLQEKGL